MTERDVAFEESLSDVWDDEDRGVQEVPLDERPFVHVGLIVLGLTIVIAAQIAFLNVGKGNEYAPRAEANLGYHESVPAPRGIIADRNGIVIAENRAVFSALLDIREFVKRPELQDDTLAAIARILGMKNDAVWTRINERDLNRTTDPIVLDADITHAELVAIKEERLPTLVVKDAFTRTYPDGEAFAALLGYVGLPTKDDLANNADLNSRELVGKSGVERYYDDLLRGRAGLHVTLRDARGTVLGEQDKRLPEIGKTLTLTIDAEFQKYFFQRFKQALHDLGRTSGVGLAMNPKNGEVLALVSFPTYDNNIFTDASRSTERAPLLIDSSEPLLNRAVAGAYNPGSTIKPLVGVAALAENIINPERTIYSPGYLDVPNPYDPSNPSRFKDWRYQGDVDLGAAIAQSSNVYFYTVGGGANGIKGLGINRLREWWKKFGLGSLTNIDMPGEAEGFLPSAEWKEQAGRPWFLGDTYNVSIGQGDLLVSPVQLLSYINAVANGGTLYGPHVNKDRDGVSRNDALRMYAREIKEVQIGMRETVTASLGTAHILDTLPFPVSGKTGSAQVKNNSEENAFFVGYGPSDDPEITILVLVENSRAGSLNAVPIAKDALQWYYEHRIQSREE